MIEEGALLDLFFSSSFSNKEVVIIFDIDDRTSPVVSGSTGRPQEDCYFIILFFFTIFLPGAARVFPRWISSLASQREKVSGAHL